MDKKIKKEYTKISISKELADDIDNYLQKSKLFVNRSAFIHFLVHKHISGGCRKYKDYQHEDGGEGNEDEEMGIKS